VDLKDCGSVYRCCISEKTKERFAMSETGTGFACAKLSEARFLRSLRFRRQGDRLWREAVRKLPFLPLAMLASSLMTIAL
jgi:hypothetical protein